MRVSSVLFVAASTALVSAQDPDSPAEGKPRYEVTNFILRCTNECAADFDIAAQGQADQFPVSSSPFHCHFNPKTTGTYALCEQPGAPEGAPTMGAFIGNKNQKVYLEVQYTVDNPADTSKPVKWYGGSEVRYQTNEDPSSQPAKFTIEATT